MMEWRRALQMFMDVRMCECIVCMKGKPIKKKRVASGHQTFKKMFLLEP
jgi:hypothetical protein